MTVGRIATLEVVLTVTVHDGEGLDATTVTVEDRTLGIGPGADLSLVLDEAAGILAGRAQEAIAAAVRDAVHGR